MIKALLLGMADSTPRFNVLMSMPNLGLASIAGNIEPSVCDVKIAELFAVKSKPKDYVINLLRSQPPHLVGLSCMSFQYQSAVEFAKLTKSYDKNILVVFGGYHPTLMYKEISESPESKFIDFIIRGEGEATFREMVTSIDSGNGYEKIAGLSYKNNGFFHHNPPRSLLPLDEIQLPNREARLIKKGFYTFGLPTDSIETSRGCTNDCKFCSIKQIYGRTFRKYPVDRVIADIKNAKKHGAKALLITDDNITLDLANLEELCDEIIVQRLNSMHYYFQASVKGVAHSAKVVQKMADAGVRIVFLGIESFSKSYLNYLRKKSSSPDETKKAIKHLRDNGIMCAGGFIVGNPDDDRKSLWDTFNTARELKLDFPVFSILIPCVKTEIREELMAEGLVTNPDDFSTYNLFKANIRTKYLTSDEIEEIVEDMYNKYFINLGYFWSNSLRKVYPFFFWKTVFQQIPFAVSDLIRKWMNGR